MNFYCLSFEFHYRFCVWLVKQWVNDSAMTSDIISSSPHVVVFVFRWCSHHQSGSDPEQYIQRAELWFVLARSLPYHYPSAWSYRASVRIHLVVQWNMLAKVKSRFLGDDVCLMSICLSFLAAQPFTAIVIIASLNDQLQEEGPITICDCVYMWF